MRPIPIIQSTAYGLHTLNEYTPSLITRLLQNPCWFKQGDMPRIYTTYIISVFLFGVFNRILKLMLVKSYIGTFIYCLRT